MRPHPLQVLLPVRLTGKRVAVLRRGGHRPREQGLDNKPQKEAARSGGRASARVFTSPVVEIALSSAREPFKTIG